MHALAARIREDYRLRAEGDAKEREDQAVRIANAVGQLFR